MDTTDPPLLHPNIEVIKTLQTSTEKTVYLVKNTTNTFGKPQVLKVYQRTFDWIYKHEVSLLRNFESESVGYPLMTSHKTSGHQHEILMKYHGKSLEDHIEIGS